MAKSVENSTGTISNTPRNRPIGRVLLDAIAEGILNTILFVFRFFGWCARWTFATLFFVGVMAFAAYFVFNEAVKGGGYVVVPNVVGLPLTKASNILAEVGLEVGRQKQVASDRFPEFHVMLQRPVSMKVVRSGRKVNLTVSAGKRYEDAPSLIGKQLEAAIQYLEGTRLLVGSVGRIPHKAPRGMVLAQDPGPARPVPTGGEIHLLVSDGPVSQAVFMPSIVGKSINDALEALASLNVEAVAYKVDRVGAEYDIVLEQQPKAGTLLYEEQVVTYDIRLLPSTFVPNSRTKVVAVFTVPRGPQTAAVRVDVIDHLGSRKTIYPRATDMIAGRPPRLETGTVISIPVAYVDEATVEFYVNGQLERAYYYQGDSDPVITDFGIRDNRVSVTDLDVNQNITEVTTKRPKFRRKAPSFPR